MTWIVSSLYYAVIVGQCFLFYHLDVASSCLQVDFCDIYFSFFFSLSLYFFKFTLVHVELFICMDCTGFCFSAVWTEQDLTTDSKAQALSHVGETWHKIDS